MLQLQTNGRSKRRRCDNCGRFMKNIEDLGSNYVNGIWWKSSYIHKHDCPYPRIYIDIKPKPFEFNEHGRPKEEP